MVFLSINFFKRKEETPPGGVWPRHSQFPDDTALHIGQWCICEHCPWYLSPPTHTTPTTSLPPPHPPPPPPPSHPHIPTHHPHHIHTQAHNFSSSVWGSNRSNQLTTPLLPLLLFGEPLTVHPYNWLLGFGEPAKAHTHLHLMDACL